MACTNFPHITNLHNFKSNSMCNLKPVTNARRKIRNFRRNFSHPIHTSLSYTIKLDFIDSKHKIKYRRKLTSVLFTKQRSLRFGSDLGVFSGRQKSFLRVSYVWRQIETAFLHVSNDLFNVNCGRTPKEFPPRQIRL